MQFYSVFDSKLIYTETTCTDELSIISILLSIDLLKSVSQIIKNLLKNQNKMC